MRNSIIVLTFFVLALAVIGCSAINVPTPEDILKTPLGTEAVKIGMTKQQVESFWGKPNDIRIVEDKKRWTSPREMWTYRAQYSAIPLDAGYLSKTKKLYFDGENLTDID